MLSEVGPNEKPVNVFARNSNDYLGNQDGVSVQALKKNVVVSKSIVHRRSRRSVPGRENDSSTVSRIKGSLMHRSNIKELIKQGNLEALEDIVIQGFGDRLIGEMSTAPLVQEFLDRVPSLIEQISELHKAAVKGSVDEFKSLVDRKDMVLARDQIGATPLHKAVLYKHQELVHYIASNFPTSLEARDHEGRTPLHYAAALQDDRMLYNTLVSCGASPLQLDNKGRSPKYYLRFPDQINTQHIIKKSQRLNTNYAINTANRIKSKSPCRKRGWSPSNRKSDPGAGGSRSDPGLSDDQEGGDADDVSSNESAGSASNLYSKANLRSRPNVLPPSAVLKRYEVTSANLKRWIEEQDLESLEGAILEGHGDRVRNKVEVLVAQNDTSSVQSYLEETFPKVMNKIRMIHAAVSCGDLNGLQDYLDKNDYALAKDHLGMAPLHKAVILGHIDVVEFILERFPETVNARDREGRSALHYAAATTNKNGGKIYKILLRAGADPRIRDNNGKTAEYYRVHLLTLPTELSKLAVNSKRKPTVKGSSGPSPNLKRRQFLLPSVQEKITSALHDGDASQLQELVLEGYGDAILGRSSWGEEARKFLKNLPHLMDNIKTMQSSIANGDLGNVERILNMDASLLRAKDENGLMPIHLATFRNQDEIVAYMIEKHPSVINCKDHFGRTPMHVAAQNNLTDLYKKLADAGGDPMILDSRGRSAEYYVKYYGTTEAASKLTNGHAAKGERRKVQPEQSGQGKDSRDSGEEGQANSHMANGVPAEELTDLSPTSQNGEVVDAAVSVGVSGESQLTPEDSIPLPDERQDTFEKETTGAETGPVEVMGDNQAAEGPDLTPGAAETNPIVSEEAAAEADTEAIHQVADTATVSEGREQVEIDEKNEKQFSQVQSGDAQPSETQEATNSVDVEENVLGEVAEGNDLHDQVTLSTAIKGKDSNQKPIQKRGKKADNGPRRQATVVVAPEEKRQVGHRKASLPITTEEKSFKSKTTKTSSKDPLKTKRGSIAGIDSTKTSKAGGKLVRRNTEVIQATGAIAASAVAAGIKEESVEVAENSTSPAEASDDATIAAEEKAREEENTTEVLPDTEKTIAEDNSIPEVQAGELKQAPTGDQADTSVGAVEVVAATDGEEGVIIPDFQQSGLDEEYQVLLEAQSRTEEAANNSIAKTENEKPSKEFPNVGDSNDVLGNVDAAVAEELKESIDDVQSEEQSVVESKEENEKETPAAQEAEEEAHAAEEAQERAAVAEETEEIQAKEDYGVADEKTIDQPPETGSGQQPLIVDVAEDAMNENTEEPMDSTNNDIEKEVENHTEEQGSRAGSNEHTQSTLSESEHGGAEHTHQVVSEPESKQKDSDDGEAKGNDKAVPEEVNEADEYGGNDEFESETEEEKAAAAAPTPTTEPEEAAPAAQSEDTATETGVEANALLTAVQDAEATPLTVEDEAESASVSERAESAKEPEENVTEDKEEAVSTDQQSEVVEQHVDLSPTNGHVSGEETGNEKEVQDHDHLQVDGNAGEITTKLLENEEQKETTEELVEDVNKLTVVDEDAANEDKNQKDDGEEVGDGQPEAAENHEDTEENGRRSQVNGTPVNSDDRLNDLIEQWLQEGDLLRLEHVVIAGQGERLIGKRSESKQVQEFLDLVPAYMAKISHVHETVVRGNFNEVRQVLTRKRFALSRDHLGASPLHLAVLHGHMDVLVYIITQFPETVDGPDNEGRTALHYAAVVGEEDIQYYEILKKSGANENLVDKLGHPPSFYLKNPGILTIRDLLESYKQIPGTGKKEPTSVDVWKRPPTADIESQLTPSSSGSPIERPASVNSEGKRVVTSKTSFHREVSADVHVDANAEETGIDPKEEEQLNEEIESMSLEFEEALKEEKGRLQESFDKVMEKAPKKGPESLTEDSISTESSESSYNLCQVKDENGQTVLHLAASKPQKKGVLFKMLAQAAYLIPERDSKYRTLRDVAIDKQLKQNILAIDEFVIDAFVKRNVPFVQNLAHEGYDLLNVVDSDGNDVTAVLRKHNINSMLNLLQDISYFQKSRTELHTFIKNDYLEGVQGLLQTDPTLITAKNKRGRCALHIAVLFHNLEIIDCLIKADPSAVNTQDNLGRTALHYAMANSKVEEIGKILIEAGANRTIRDVRMRTPSYYFVYPDEIREIKREEKTLE